MQSEIILSKQLEVNESLQKREGSTRLLKFFEVLVQINKREKIVKNYREDNKRNTGNTSKSK